MRWACASWLEPSCSLLAAAFFAGAFFAAGRLAAFFAALRAGAFFAGFLAAAFFADFFFAGIHALRMSCRECRRMSDAPQVKRSPRGSKHFIHDFPSENALRVLVLRESGAIHAQICVRKKHEADFVERIRMCTDLCTHGAQCNACSALCRVAVSACAHRGKRDGAELLRACLREGIAVRAREKSCFTVRTAAPDRTHRVNDAARRQSTGRRGYRLARGQPLRKARSAQGAALCEDLGTTAAMNCAVDATATEQC